MQHILLLFICHFIPILDSFFHIFSRKQMSIITFDKIYLVPINLISFASQINFLLFFDKFECFIQFRLVFGFFRLHFFFNLF